MRYPFRLSALALALAAFLPPALAAADGLRLVASDARGVTLQVTSDTWTLSGPGKDGRVVVLGVPQAHSLADPGHGLLPAYATMLAVPLDARPTVRVVSSAPMQERLDVRLRIAQKPTFEKDADGEYEPTAADVTPLTDGLWPSEVVKLGTPSAFRGRRLLGVEVRPYQYDEAGHRLVVTPGMTVRVDFNRPVGAAALPVIAQAPDPHVDDVLGSSVLNFEQARAWRAAPAADPASASLFGSRRARPGSAQATLADDQPEVRVRLDSTGVYLLAYEPLAANGYPAGTPIGQVSVHRHEFLEGQSVPYTTIEMPCEVDDVDHDGIFGTGDRIWLYTRTWAERSGASNWQRFWGDAEVVFVTVNPAGGKRVPQRGGWRGQAGLTPLASYPHTQHWETSTINIMSFVTLPSDTAQDLYHWTDLTFWNDRPDSITFGIHSIDTTHAVQFKIGWMGRAANTHYISAAVKNPGAVLTTVADNVYWYGKAPQVTNATITGSALGEGTNRFVDWGKTDPTPYDPVTNNRANVALNWFEATYWRRFRAVHDRLTFNTANASGEVQIHGDFFFTDSIRIYDVTQPDAPVRVVPDPAHFSGGTFDIQDSVASGQPHQYAAAGVQEPIDPDYGPMQPPAGAFARVTRRPLYTNTVGDYLLVVPEAFLSEVAPLAALRTSQNLSVVVATTEQIYDEFNGGRHSAAAIQRFVRYAYANWSSRFMVLVGDGTLDPRNHLGYAGTDWVPVLPVPGPVPVGEGYEVVPSDNAYACLTGNCDPVFGSGDILPEVMIGRLPANSATDVHNMVAKIVKYEDLTGDQSWRTHVMLVSDDAYSTDAGGGVTPGGSAYCWKDYEEHFVGLNRKVRSVILGEAGLAQMNVEPFDLRSYITNPSYYIVNGPQDTCRIDRNSIVTYTRGNVTPVYFSHINSGTLWSNFQGHANEYVLTHESLYQNSGDLAGSDDKSLYSNPGKPVIFTAFSCHANMFARSEGGPASGNGGCLGEDMVVVPDGGAIASWASSCYEVVPRDDSTHINVALARAMFSDPPNDPSLASGGSRVVLGEAIQATYVRFMPRVASYIYERGTPITYTLLGDPAQRVWIGQPQMVVHANDSLVVDGVPVRLHSPGDTLTLVANVVSTVRLDSLALFINEGSGDVAIPLAPEDIVPAFPDTLNGGVYGGRRFTITYRTTLKTESYRYRFHTRDRDGLQKDFNVVFQFDARLRSNALPIQDNDIVAPNANLSVLLVSPAPLDPTTLVTLTVNGVVPAGVTATPAPGDASGREWILGWTHPDYASGSYTVVIATSGGPTITHTFRVTTGAVKLDQVFAFPNPFDNDGTRFSFMLLGAEPADVRITIHTISGRRIWSQDFPGLAPGYHQLPWNGQDAEGAVLANGNYFYRISATTPSGQKTDQLGRMVKLRRPRHVDVETTNTTP